jgi:P4 family phage/plasmid primase-like protien
MGAAVTTLELEQEARSLIRRGLPIVVCDGKVPLGGKAWHTKPVTESNLPTLLRQAANPAIGLKLGEFIDIEADSPEEEALIAKLFEGCEPPATPTYKSTRGKHRVYRSNEQLRNLGRAVVNFSDGTEAKLGIRIGANGMAAQSVIPPSAGREWLVSWDDCEPADLPSVVVERIIAAAKPVETRSNVDDSEHSDEVDEHLLALMRRIKPKPGERDGSKRLLALACRAVEHDASDATAIATIRAYDSEQPLASEWSDADILRRLRDAERKVQRGTGTKLTVRNCTDLGNAERFSEQHGADVRFSHVWSKWLAWDGRRWAIDTTGEIPRRAKRTARSIWAEAVRAPKRELRERLGQWASSSEKRDRINAMIALASSEQPIPIAVEQLDADPYLFNVENGTIDLRTGELREHRREDFLTKVCKLKYPTSPGIDPDLWLEFLDRIFASNAKLIRFVRQLAGVAMLGEVQEHVLPIFYGSGANGKSVWLETICGVFGEDYAMKAPPGLLITSKGDRHPTELADLHGKRFVAAVESEEHGRLSEALVKELTGGDSIRARRMREDFWQFKPSHTVVLATNHKPTIRGTDHGIWRRIRLVPFAVRIPDHEQDKQLSNKLRSEWAAILRWCVAGCLDWQRNGLVAPDEVVSATSDYRSDMDVMGEFVDECCCVGPSEDVKASSLFARYKSWGEERGEYIETQTRFGTRLAERGFQKDKRSGRIWYRGIGLRDS